MDMLIKLYALPTTTPRLLAHDITIRKPIGPEHEFVAQWVAKHFSAVWASEALAALGNRPASLFVAEQADAPIGFACYDATARGMFGPIGVLPEARSHGIGEALLLACLHDMRSVGYAYAVAGWVGPMDFFRRVAGATLIEDSEPGIYRGMLRG